MAPKETKQAENNCGKPPEKEGRFRRLKSFVKKIKDSGKTTEDKPGLNGANERKNHPADGKDGADGAVGAKTSGQEQNSVKGQDIDRNTPHSANDSPEKNPSNDKSSSVSISTNLWDTAYEKLKDKSKDLVLGYEKVLSFEMGQSEMVSGQTGPPPSDVPNQISADPKVRRQQMENLARSRVERSEARGMAKEAFKMSVTALNQIKGVIGTALQVYPVAGLAWAGVSLILEGLVVSVKASAANVEGLTHVMSLIGWYMKLSNLLLRQRFPNDNEFNAAHGHISDLIVDLYKSLIEYQMRSVYRYYRHHRIVTFLQDQAGLNDWDGKVTEITKKEGVLIDKARQYGEQASIELLYKQYEQSIKAVELMGQVVEILSSSDKRGAEAEKRDMRREQRELEQKGEAVQAKINGLIKIFTTEGPDYEDFKNGPNDPPDPGTCDWFTNHPKYGHWEKEDSGVLLLSAGPGLGKSVLARSLVDKMKKDGGLLVCHFFFKDTPSQDNAFIGLCAILHQIFTQKRQLILYFEDTLSTTNKKNVQSSPEKLWKIFEETVPRICDKTVVCVFDGLDECEETSREHLIKLMRTYFTSTPRGVKFLITCRPRMEIVNSFRSAASSYYTELQVGDTETEYISQDVDLVIKRRLDELADHTDERTVDILRKRIRMLDAQNKTYLWVRLVFKLLNEEDVMVPMENLPETVDDAYDALLSKIPEEKQSIVRVILHILLVAEIPLEVDQLNIAQACWKMKARRGCRDSDDELQIQNVTYFKTWIEDTCGFVVQVFRGRVGFIHQTVKDFLLREVNEPPPLTPAPKKSKVKWKHSISWAEASATMATSCMVYLSHNHFFDGSPIPELHNLPCPGDLLRVEAVEHMEEDCFLSVDSAVLATADDSINAYTQHYPFLRYAATLWVYHFEECQVYNPDEKDFPNTLRDVDDELNDTYFRLFYVPNICHSIWLRWWVSSSEMADRIPNPRMMDKSNALLLGIQLRHFRLMRYGIGEDQSPDDEIPIGIHIWFDRSRSALHWACRNNNWEMVKWLLYYKADPDSTRARYGRAPLHWCRNIKVLNLLLDAGATIDIQDDLGDTPLYVASTENNVGRAKALVAKGANVDATNKRGESPLYRACLFGFRAMTRLLLDSGANLNLKASNGLSPFEVAVRRDRVSALLGLLDKPKVGSQAHLVDRSVVLGALCESPSVILTREHLLDIEKIISSKPHLDMKYRFTGGRTFLHLVASRAASDFSVCVAKRLLQQGADPNALDDDQQTPLFTFCFVGALHDNSKAAREFLALLFRYKANPTILDKNGIPMLHILCLLCSREDSHNSGMEILRGFLKTADAKILDTHGQNALHRLCQAAQVESANMDCCLNVAKLLLDLDVDPDIEGIDGRSARDIAVEGSLKKLIRLFAGEEAQSGDDDADVVTPPSPLSLPSQWSSPSPSPSHSDSRRRRRRIERQLASVDSASTDMLRDDEQDELSVGSDAGWSSASSSSSRMEANRRRRRAERARGTSYSRTVEFT